jgi:Ca2+-binding RTX toxin-like protein
VQSDGVPATGGDAQGDVLTSIEHLIGSGHDDQLLGTGAGNDLYGGSGDDLLTGAGGNDRLDGGYGYDTIFGGVGSDTLFSGPDAITPTQGDTLYGGSDADIFQSKGDTSFNSRDRLFGDDGDDIFYADGQDQIEGGAGYDTVMDAANTRTDYINGIEEIVYSSEGAWMEVHLSQIDDLERITSSVNTLVQLESFTSWTKSATATNGYFLWTAPNSEQLWISTGCTVTGIL